MVDHDWLFGAAQPSLPSLLAAAIDPATRAKLLMALLGLVILGLGLMLLAMVGGRMVRRMTRDSKPPGGQIADPWYQPKRAGARQFTYEDDDDEEETSEEDSDGGYDTDDDVGGADDDDNR
jgi:hypothetical protein